jgi:hypothetical protein
VLPVDPCSVETVTRVGLGVAGVIEGLGTIFTLIGLPSRSYYAHDGASLGPRWQIVPMQLAGGGGAAAFGTF